MQHWRRFLTEATGEHARICGERLRAAAASLSFDPGPFAEQQFLRYRHLRAIASRVGSLDMDGHRVLEVGGSNSAIHFMFERASYEVAPNYPEVDVQDLARYKDGSFHVIVVDHVLEHVGNPQRAIDELRRVLAPGGVCIATTPFLIRVHGYPDDYHRFTATALERLFAGFSSVEVDGWGNRYTLEVIHRYGWLSAKNTKRLLHVALWNEPEWPIEYLSIATK